MTFDMQETVHEMEMCYGRLGSLFRSGMFYIFEFDFNWNLVYVVTFCLMHNECRKVNPQTFF